MANSPIDEICPPYVGENVITLGLSSETLVPRSRTGIIITIGYPEDIDISLPLEVTVMSPNPNNFYRDYIRYQKPSEFLFVSLEPGTHTVRIAEFGRNRSYGALTFEVAK